MLFAAGVIVCAGGAAALLDVSRLLRAELASPEPVAVAFVAFRPEPCRGCASFVPRILLSPRRVGSLSRSVLGVVALLEASLLLEFPLCCAVAVLHQHTDEIMASAKIIFFIAIVLKTEKQ